MSGSKKSGAMAEIILHQFDASPFAEKIRLTLGFKGLEWDCVDIPMIMPKPELMPLTGGYRKTPVLQVGADIYCDTRLIMDELERCYPNPTLHPQGATGLTSALHSWSDCTFFEPGAGLSMGLNENLPEPLLTDRKAFFKFMDFDTLQESLPHLYGQYLAQLQLLERQLSGANDYLMGSDMSAIDILAYYPLWMARGNFPEVDGWMHLFPQVLKWEALMKQVGHGTRNDIDASEALGIARDAMPGNTGKVMQDPAGWSKNQPVTVSPTDNVEITIGGELVELTLNKIVIRREDDRAGATNNHFPRTGYRIEGLQ